MWLNGIFVAPMRYGDCMSLVCLFVVLDSSMLVCHAVAHQGQAEALRLFVKTELLASVSAEPPTKNLLVTCLDAQHFI